MRGASSDFATNRIGGGTVILAHGQLWGSAPVHLVSRPASTRRGERIQSRNVLRQSCKFMQIFAPDAARALNPRRGVFGDAFPRPCAGRDRGAGDATARSRPPRPRRPTPARRHRDPLAGAALRRHSDRRAGRLNPEAYRPGAPALFERRCEPHARIRRLRRRRQWAGTQARAARLRRCGAPLHFRLRDSKLIGPWRQSRPLWRRLQAKHDRACPRRRLPFARRTGRRHRRQ